MRLRPLTEAECYARCYGGHPGDSVSLVHVLPEQGRLPTSGERLQELFSVRVDSPLVREEEAA
jgi:hypothetical protein